METNLKPTLHEKILFVWPIIILFILLLVYFFIQDTLFEKMKYTTDGLAVEIPTFEKSIPIWEKNDLPLYSFLTDPNFNLLLVDYSKLPKIVHAKE